MLYVTKLIPSSAHFFQIAGVQHKICFTSEPWCFLLLCFCFVCKLNQFGPGLFCRNQSFPFCAVYRCADFSQYFRTFPCFYKYIFKINGSYLGAFFREIFILRSLWNCFLSIVIAILKTRDFLYLHQTLTKLCSLLILLTVILYQLSLSVIVISSIFWFRYSWLSNRSINIKHIVNNWPVF